MEQLKRRLEEGFSINTTSQTLEAAVAALRAHIGQRAAHLGAPFLQRLAEDLQRCVQAPPEVPLIVGISR
eukprot:5062565-Pyramimonas_sp.AAC.2